MKNFGTIDFKAAHQLQISITEYLYLDQLDFLSNGEKSRKMNGWVYANQKTIAKHLGVSDRTLRNFNKNLASKGLLLIDEESKMIKTSEKWHKKQELKNEDEVEKISNEVEKISSESGKNFLHKIDTKGEKKEEEKNPKKDLEEIEEPEENQQPKSEVTKSEISPKQIIESYKKKVSSKNQKIRESQSFNLLGMILDREKEFPKILKGIENYASNKSSKEEYIVSLSKFIQEKIYLDYQEDKNNHPIFGEWNA